MPPIILFRVPGETEQHLGGLRTLPAELEIDWDLFFFGPNQPPDELNRSNKMDPVIAFRLAHLPPDGKSLVRLNLQRSNALGLPSGPDVARAMARVDPAIEPLTEIDPAKLPDYEEITVSTLQAMLPRLPLWAYVLLEARLLCNGEHLGPVGGTIVAEVLVGLLEADESSYLHQQPAWKPDRRLADANRDFRMRHLLNFTLGPSTP